MRKTIFSLVLSGMLVSCLANERALISDDYSNYFSTAKEIPLNTTINGNIETVDDIDIFKFTLDKDDGITFYGQSFDNEGYHIAFVYVIEKTTIETLSDYLNEENWDIRHDVIYSIKNLVEYE